MGFFQNFIKRGSGYTERKRQTGSWFQGPQYGPPTPAGFNYSQVDAPTSAVTTNTAKPLVSSSATLNTSGLAEANARRTAGIASQADIANLQYAESKGWKAGSTGFTDTTAGDFGDTQSGLVTPASAGAAAAKKTYNPYTDYTFLRKVAQDKLAQLQEQYAGTLTPSQEEAALQKTITDYVGAANQGISAEEGQGRLKTLGLVRGRQGKLEEQANLQTQTYEGQLQNLQNERTAKSSALFAQLGFEQGRFNDTETSQRNAENIQMQMMSAGYEPVDPTSPDANGDGVVNIGGQLYRQSADSKQEKMTGQDLQFIQNGYTPISGPSQLKALAAQGVTEKDLLRIGTRIYLKPTSNQGLIELAAGASLYDPTTGQIVNTAPKTFASSSGGGSDPLGIL